MDFPLKTERLCLSSIVEDDIGRLIELCRQPESYLQYEEHDGEPAAESLLEHFQEYIEEAKTLPEKGGICFAVRYSGEIIGEVHLYLNYEHRREWEIGYRFFATHWGKGYAFEAVQAVLFYAFEHFNAHKVVAFLNAQNHRSHKLVKRLGMHYEGTLREARLIDGNYYDEYIYSMLESDFADNNKGQAQDEPAAPNNAF